MEGRTRGKLTRRWGHNSLGRPSPASNDGAVNSGATGAGTSPLPRQRVVTASRRCLSLRGSSSTILVVSTSMAPGVVLLLLGLVARDWGRARVRGAPRAGVLGGTGTGLVVGVAAGVLGVGGGEPGERGRLAKRAGGGRARRQLRGVRGEVRRACSAAASRIAFGVKGDCVYRR